MKTHIILFLSAIALLCTFTSCQTEGGDIGDLYGEWALRSMTVDGQPAQIDCSAYYFRFQGDMLGITVTAPYNNFQVSWGTWQRSGDILKVSFTYHNSAEGSESGALFNPPAELGIPSRATTDMRIVSLTSEDMALEMTAPDGKSYHYTFHKLQ